MDPSRGISHECSTNQENSSNSSKIAKTQQKNHNQNDNSKQSCNTERHEQEEQPVTDKSIIKRGIFRQDKDVSKWSTKFVRNEVEEANKGIGYLIQQVMQRNEEMEAKIKRLEKSGENRGL